MDEGKQRDYDRRKKKARFDTYSQSELLYIFIIVSSFFSKHMQLD